MSYHKAQRELDKPTNRALPIHQASQHAHRPTVLGVLWGPWGCSPPLLIPQIMVLKGRMAESDGVGNMEVQGGILKDLLAEAKLSQ